MESCTLHNGATLPLLGYNANNESIEYEQAIQKGIRHFLVPFEKEKQSLLKSALENSGLTRDEFFLTAILTNENTLPLHREFELLCKALDTDYMDCLLTGWHSANTSKFEDSSRMIPVWSTMENLYKKGDTRVIGVLDITPIQLEALLHIVHIAPIVALLDGNSANMPFASLNAVQEHNIQPLLLLSEKHMDPSNRTLALMAENHATSILQIVEAWLTSKNCALISDTVLEESILKLNAQEIALLDALAEQEE